MFEVGGELLGLEKSGVLGVEAKDESDAKPIERIFLVGGQELDGIVLDAAGLEHFSSEGITNAADDVDGVLRQFDFLDVVIVWIDEEIEALELRREVCELDGLKAIGSVVEERREAIEIVNAELVEVADDDPPWAATVRKPIGVALCLLEWSKKFAVGLTGGLIEIDASGLVLDQDFGRGNEGVDEALMSDDDDGHFKLNEARGLRDAECADGIHKGIVKKLCAASQQLTASDIIDQKRGEKALEIRNFSIIAHIDHGKSTLADRLIEMTGTVAKREMSDQLLDNMELERERGITIKAQTVRLKYTASDGKEYRLNLIDTPGHVDFNYEVSRSLAACEGALLVVDATQGVEAQTLSNVYLALDHDLEIIPVINKIDLPSADPDRARHEIEDAIGLDASGAILCSAKTGAGVDEILEAIVELIPAPRGDRSKSLKALIFDSQFDSYKGAVAHVRIFDGSVRKGDRLKLLATGKEFEATELGYFSPSMMETEELSAGDVGYICGSLKDVRDVRVGDTITEVERPSEALPGYRAPMPMVYAGLYPTDNVDYENLKDALEKLQLNDAALVYEPETSAALGFGFRCGFLGLLHLDVIQERLEREYNLNLVMTAPSVVYRVTQTDGAVLMIDNPAKLPPQTKIATIEEPLVKATVIVPSDYIGAVMDICRERRGTYVSMDYVDKTRVMLTYELPLAEILYDFFDRLKSMTRGYASLDYAFERYAESDVAKLDILLNGEIVDALSTIVHKSRAARVGRALALKLKRTIPRHQFEIPIQAAIGGRVVARENIKQLAKDVTAKCYGGHIDRRLKLIRNQRENKKRMKAIGKVTVPQEAFMTVLKLTDEDFD